MKTIKRKKSQSVVKDTEPKDKAQGSTEDGREKILSSHIRYIYLSSGSYDLQLPSYQRIVRINWNGENWKI